MPLAGLYGVDETIAMILEKGSGGGGGQRGPGPHTNRQHIGAGVLEFAGADSRPSRFVKARRLSDGSGERPTKRPHSCSIPETIGRMTQSLSLLLFADAHPS
jgi:hypothetical protein